MTKPELAISAATANCICSTFSRVTTPASSDEGVTSARWSTRIASKRARHSGVAPNNAPSILCRTGRCATTTCSFVSRVIQQRRALKGMSRFLTVFF